MPPPPKPVNGGKLIDPKRHGTGRDITHPRTVNGVPIHQKPLVNRHNREIAPGHDHIKVINNHETVNHIRGVHNRWNRNDHEYHHERWGGHDMWHHYDHRGFHWWGFYLGEIYFWTRYYNDLYWWWDPYYHRWCHMRNGRWWWQGPDRVVYIYDNGSYSRYEETNGGVVVTPDPTPPVEAPPVDPNPEPEPAPEPKQATFYSGDGTRSILVKGANGEAWLYDQSNPESEPKFLESGVNLDSTETKVEFTQTDPFLIILHVEKAKEDGTVDKYPVVFDQDGNIFNPKPPEEAKPQPVPPVDGDDKSGDDDQSSLRQNLTKSSVFGVLSTGGVGSIRWQ